MPIRAGDFRDSRFHLLSDYDQGGNAACWGNDSRGDISCIDITEKLLLSFRGKDEDVVRKAMKAPGRSQGEGLDFLSNTSRGKKIGAGDVTFENGLATIVSAAVDFRAPAPASSNLSGMLMQPLHSAMSLIARLEILLTYPFALIFRQTQNLPSN